jgi:hypothetical protein
VCEVTGVTTPQAGFASDMAKCQARCKTYPEGMKSDKSGNTLGCRIYHVGVAGLGGPDSADRTTHCPHAGRSGAGVCGTSCESFCEATNELCGSPNKQYSDKSYCLAMCALFPPGTASDTGGNTLGCRDYHLTVASTTDPDFHCPHQGPYGDGVCGASQCDTYCDGMLTLPVTITF